MFHLKPTLAILVTATALAAAAVAPAAAQQPPEQEPRMPIERLLKDLKGVGAHYQNSKVKIGRGMAGMSIGEAGGQQRPPTPAEACCSSNLDHVTGKLQKMNRTLEHLYLYYKDRRDSEAIGVLETIRAEMHAVARGFAAFRMEQTTEGAQQAMVGILRPYHRLREAIEQLEACCPVDPGIWTEPAAGPRRP
jgi:hypothetical protein